MGAALGAPRNVYLDAGLKQRARSRREPGRIAPRHDRGIGAIRPSRTGEDREARIGGLDDQPGSGRQSDQGPEVLSPYLRNYDAAPRRQTHLAAAEPLRPARDLRQLVSVAPAKRQRENDACPAARHLQRAGTRRHWALRRHGRRREPRNIGKFRAQIGRGVPHRQRLPSPDRLGKVGQHRDKRRRQRRRRRRSAPARPIPSGETDGDAAVGDGDRVNLGIELDEREPSAAVDHDCELVGKPLDGPQRGFDS